MTKNACPECGTPLDEVPFKRCDAHDRADALLAGLMNVKRTTQHRIDEIEEAAYERAAEENDDVPDSWDMFQTGKDW